MEVPGQCHAAQRAPRGQTRLVTRHASANVLVFEQDEMSIDLARGIVVEPFATEGID